MSKERRRQRSVRLIVATTLLTAAGVLVTVAVVVASQILLSISAVAALAAGVAAARIIVNELAQTRREWAKDRAAQAHDYQRMADLRSRENAIFAQAMRAKLDQRIAQVADRDKQIAKRDATLSQRNAKIADLGGKLKESQERVTVVEAENAELTESLDTLRAEHDQLTTGIAKSLSDGDVPSVEDMMQWHGTAADVEDERKQA